MILALAVVLLAAPVWADVTITLTAVSDTEVEIGYEATEPVRAFALDVTVTDGTVTDVTEFVIGDDNGGFGIFPANFSRFITVNDQTGEVDDWGVPGYSPVADGGDPGAQGGLDTNGVTLEMGALYDTNGPGLTGTLCKVTVEYAPAASTELCVVGNALRGNVVLEDATEVVPVEACITLPPPVDECFPSNFTTYADWVTYGKPKCWCNTLIDPTATGDYQCDGDGDNATQGLPKYRIYTNDLNLLIPNWKLKIDTADPCADYDHKKQGLPKYRVYTNDLQKLIDNWKKKDADLPGNCGLAVDMGGKTARPE
jgi:hypothetical protein